MSESLVLKPWKRYGKDRTYVTSAGGATLGYQDNLTGVVVVDDEAFRPAVERALAGSNSLGADRVERPSPPAPDLTSYAITITQLDDDLRLNAPGASAAALAEAKRAAAPGRSMLARFFGVHTAERAWRVGAKGEQIVGRELEQLRTRGWEVVHDVPVGDRGANIDHVVVGPGGVFTVNSKYHWGKRVVSAGNTVYVNGQVTSYVVKAQREAHRAARLLTAASGVSVPVRGLLVVVSDRRTIKNRVCPRFG